MFTSYGKRVKQDVTASQSSVLGAISHQSVKVVELKPWKLPSIFCEATEQSGAVGGAAPLQQRERCLVSGILPAICASFLSCSNAFACAVYYSVKFRYLRSMSRQTIGDQSPTFSPAGKGCCHFADRSAGFVREWFYHSRGAAAMF